MTQRTAVEALCLLRCTTFPIFKLEHDMKADTASAAYVYVIEIDGIVRYIGKGRNGRMYFHRLEAARTLKRVKNKRSLSLPRFQRKLVAALRDGAAIEEKLIESDLSDLDAYKLETKLIGEHHLLRPGQLWNTIDERFIDAKYLPAEWSDPEHPMYRLPRPLGGAKERAASPLRKTIRA
jgi:hypothetical protein